MVRTPGTMVASGYCWMFRYTEVLGMFPRTAVLGLVTCKRILANDIETCPQNTQTKSENEIMMA